MSILQPFSACGCGDTTFVYDADPPDDLDMITQHPDPTCQYLTKEAACCKGCGSSKCVRQCGRYGEEYTYTYPDGRKEKRFRPIPSGMYSCADVDCKDPDIDKREANSKTIIMAVSISALVLMVILFLVLGSFQYRRGRRRTMFY